MAPRRTRGVFDAIRAHVQALKMDAVVLDGLGDEQGPSDPQGVAAQIQTLDPPERRPPRLDERVLQDRRA